MVHDSLDLTDQMQCLLNLVNNHAQKLSVAIAGEEEVGDAESPVEQLRAVE